LSTLKASSLDGQQRANLPHARCNASAAGAACASGRALRFLSTGRGCQPLGHMGYITNAWV